MPDTTISGISTIIRGLAYDKVPTPMLYIKKADSGNLAVQVNGSGLSIVNTTSGNTLLLNVPPTTSLSDCFDVLVSDYGLYSVAQSYAFRDKFLVSDLLPTFKLLTGTVSLFTRYYYSQADVIDLMKVYMVKYRKCLFPSIDDTALQVLLNQLINGIERHLEYWVAYYLVDQRRLDEFASNNLEISFSNAPDEFGSEFSELSLSRNRFDVAVAVGDVFHITDNEQKKIEKDINRAGNNNFFGDDSFWYRYQMFLRYKFETLFGDYSLRPNDAIVGNIILERPELYNAYFTDYPYAPLQSPEGIPRSGY